MNLTALRSFHAVATCGTFTAAARRLHVTQPTLSAQVKSLEEHYGVKLFARGARGVRLSQTGTDLLAITHQLFDLQDEAEQLMTAARGLKRGQLRVGADAPAHVMPALSAFRRRHPAVELSVAIGNSKQMLDAVHREEVDLAVVAEAIADPVLYALPVKTDPLVIVVSRRHRWARRRTLGIAELSAEPFVAREIGSTTRALFEQAISSSAVELGPTLEIASREGVREAVAAGLGIGVVFDSEFGHDVRLHKLRLRDITLAGVEYAICLKRRRRRAVVEAFLALLVAS